MNKYSHIFFDLDRTIWDFDKNSIATLNEIFEKYNLENILNCSFDDFFKTYKKHNTILWEAYRNNQIKKEKLSIDRFLFTLNDINNDDLLLASNISEDYIKLSPLKKNLLPYSIETLEILSKKFKLHILTNGFKEVQYIKVRKSGLEKYFTHIITSEEAGVQKPDKKIFEYALKITGATPENSIMIGDDLKVDILGAMQVGMDQIYFNCNSDPSEHQATYEIKSLIELTYILN